MENVGIPLGGSARRLTRWRDIAYNIEHVGTGDTLRNELPITSLKKRDS